MMMIYAYLSQEGLNNELVEACKKGDLNMVAYLLSSPELQCHAQIHAMDSLPLRQAVIFGHMDVVQYLLTSPELKEHADINGFDHSILQVACMAGKYEAVKYLLSSPHLKEYPDIDAHDGLALKWACEAEALAVVDFLLKSPQIKAIGGKHANVHANEDAAFKTVCANDCAELIAYFIYDYGIKMTQEIRDYVSDKPSLRTMFEQRDLAIGLECQLPVNQLHPKRVKI